MRGQPPLFPVKAPAKPVAWVSFVNDILFLMLPYIGIAFGFMFAGTILGKHFTTSSEIGWVLAQAKYVLMFGGIGWLLRLAYSFGSNFRSASIVDLVGEVEVSHIRSIPVTVRGKIIGRGIPGLFWSKDLVLQDETGFITLIYRQPLGILETLFGWLKADQFVGFTGTARGWYRRGPSPYLELLDFQIDNNGARMMCHQKTFLWVAAFVCTFIGFALMAVGS
jgi:heat shock protein HtpX